VDLAEQTRDVHLGDPDVVGDLLLGELLEVAQLDDAPVSLTEPVDDPGKHRSRLGGLVTQVVVSDQVSETGGRALLGADRTVQGRRVETTLGRQRFYHVVDVLREVLRDLRRTR